MVDVAPTRIGRCIEHMYVVAGVHVIRVTRQPERPVGVDAAVFRVEATDARLNGENATCNKPRPLSSVDTVQSTIRSI